MRSNLRDALFTTHKRNVIRTTEDTSGVILDNYAILDKIVIQRV